MTLSAIAAVVTALALLTGLFALARLARLPAAMREVHAEVALLKTSLGELRESSRGTILGVVPALNRVAKRPIPIVTYLKPVHRQVPLLHDVNLLKLALANDIGLATACGGIGDCGMCAIDVHEGGDRLPPVNETEVSFLGPQPEGKRRLACQCQPTGDIVIEGVN